MQGIAWLIAGAIGGAVGAAVWAAVAHFANAEVGWIAWGVGALVGFGVRVAAKDNAGFGPGAVAVAVALVAVIAGKFAAVSLDVNRFEADVRGMIQFDINEDRELLISYVADEMVKQEEEAGRTVKWPQGVDPALASEKADYPPALWNRAEKFWDSLSPTDQDQRAAYYASEARRLVGEGMAAERADMESEAFLDSFSLFDLLWFLLAGATAWSLGSGLGGSND